MENNIIEDNLYSCSLCDYKTNRNYNLKRHHNAMHLQNNEIKVVENKENNIKIEENIIKIEENIIKIENNIFYCKKCNKKYKTEKSYIKHEEKCNGLNILACPKCKKIFSNRASKSEHIKRNNCKEKIIIETNPNLYQYIYLLHEREFIKTNENIYKIGKSKQENTKRISSYPKGSKLLFQIICNDCDDLENKLINKFKIICNHKKEIGNEYFQGDCYKMITEICNIIIKK